MTIIHYIFTPYVDLLQTLDFSGEPTLNQKAILFIKKLRLGSDADNPTTDTPVTHPRRYRQAPTYGYCPTTTQQPNNRVCRNIGCDSMLWLCVSYYITQTHPGTYLIMYTMAIAPAPDITHHYYCTENPEIFQCTFPYNHILTYPLLIWVPCKIVF